MLPVTSNRLHKAVAVSEPMRMLGHAHRPDAADGIGFDDHIGRLLQRLAGDAAALDGELEREFLQRRLEFVEMIDVLADEFLGVVAVVDHVFRDRVHPDHVGGRRGLEMQIGALGQLVLAQVGDDMLLPVQLGRPLEAGRDHGMAFGRVRADDQQQLGGFQIGDRASIGAIAHSTPQPLGGRRLTIARAVVDVVRAHHAARELLHQIAFLVGALRGSDVGQRIRTVGVPDLVEPTRDERVCLVPFRLAERAVLANQRLGQTMFAVDMAPAELALDAGRNRLAGASCTG